MSKSSPKRTRTKARRRESQALLYQLTSWRRTPTRNERRDSWMSRKKFKNKQPLRKKTKKMLAYRPSKPSTKRSTRNKVKT